MSSLFPSNRSQDEVHRAVTRLAAVVEPMEANVRENTESLEKMAESVASLSKTVQVTIAWGKGAYFATAALFGIIIAVVEILRSR